MSNEKQASMVESLNWRIADDIDAAFGIGLSDATERRQRDSILYPVMNAAYFAYHLGFNEGLRQRQEAGETLPPGMMAEAAWFDEICEAGQTQVEPIDADVMEEIEDEQIGEMFSRQPYLW